MRTLQAEPGWRAVTLKVAPMPTCVESMDRHADIDDVERWIALHQEPDEVVDVYPVIGFERRQDWTGYRAWVPIIVDACHIGWLDSFETLALVAPGDEIPDWIAGRAYMHMTAMLCAEHQPDQDWYERIREEHGVPEVDYF